MMNIFRQEYDEGIEIRVPHRPKLDDAGAYVRDADGNMAFHTVRVRSISFGYVAKSGKMPSYMQGIVANTIMGLGLGDESADVEETKVDDLDLINQMDDYQRYVISEMLVSPKVVENPKKENEISYAMLTADDIIFFMSLLDFPLTDLRTFPAIAEEGLAVVPEQQSDEMAEVTE